MTEKQEPKYKIENGKIVNRHSGEAIPDDEPIMIFRGRDRHAMQVIATYATMIKDEERKVAVIDRATEFALFRKNFPKLTPNADE